MATSPEERFKRIFAAAAKPALPDPCRPHLAETELRHPNQAEQMQYQIPKIPQVQHNFVELDHSGARDIISSSEDEDDYVNAFKSSLKPSMLTSKQQMGRIGRKSRTAAAENLGTSSHTNIALPEQKSESAPDVSPPAMMYLEVFTGIDTMETGINLPSEDGNGNKTTGNFCIFSLVAKFPYKYMKDPNDKVSKRFFANNKFYSREWDVYYLHPPETMYAQPILLLPVEQVQKLLSEISSSFHINVNLPTVPFTMSFFNDKTPQPVFLGTTRSRTEYDELQKKITPATAGHGECPEGASQRDRRAFEDFRSKCEGALAANKRGKTKKQEKRAKEKLVAFHQASSGLRRSQRYFGLRLKKTETSAPTSSLSWDNQPVWETQHVKKSNISLESLDINKKAPHPFEKDVVIVSFDVEANEHAHHLITEIGVSTLDTQDLHDLPPGAGGENWIKRIRSRHFRIKEHSHMRNKTFISGNPDGFYFGVSEFVGLKNGEAVKAVDGCFSFPFSHGYQHDGKKSVPQSNQPAQRGPENRRIVLVGHDTQTDIDFLSKLGSEIFTSSITSYPPIAKHEALTRIEEALDIATLYRTLKNETQTRSLGGILTDLDRDAWGLHNGGNDARYTLECLVGMTIKARVEDDAKAKKAADEKAKLDHELEEANRAWASPAGKPGPKVKSKSQTSNLTAAEKAEIERQIEETNRAWAARDAELDNQSNPNDPASTATEDCRHSANTANEYEPAADTAAPDANKFLNPAFMPASACPPPPGRGRHYGSDDELDEIFDGDYEDEDLGQATEAKLRLGDNGDDGDGSESEFEM